LTTRKPEVVSVTRCRRTSDSVRAKTRIPTRRRNEETRADDDVRLVREKRREDLRQLRRIVLAVAVDLHSDVEAVLVRVAVARLDRSADAQVERQAQHVDALRSGDGGGAVDRAVVDDDDLEPRVEGADLVDHRADARFLVERGHDRKSPLGRELRLHHRRLGLRELDHAGSAAPGREVRPIRSSSRRARIA
jgi:hypothetical protein